MSFGGGGGGPFYAGWRSKIKLYIAYVTPYAKLDPGIKFYINWAGKRFKSWVFGGRRGGHGDRPHLAYATFYFKFYISAKIW